MNFPAIQAAYLAAVNAAPAAPAPKAPPTAGIPVAAVAAYHEKI